jgi:translation initiation factor IF-3
MDLIYVDSSNIDQIGYDEDTNETHVIFKNGGRHYIYSEVSMDVWERFRDSTSKGKFVNQEFKAKGYPCRQV